MTTKSFEEMKLDPKMLQDMILAQIGKSLINGIVDRSINTSADLVRTALHACHNNEHAFDLLRRRREWAAARFLVGDVATLEIGPIADRTL